MFPVNQQLTILKKLDHAFQQSEGFRNLNCSKWIQTSQFIVSKVKVLLTFAGGRSAPLRETTYFAIYLWRLKAEQWTVTMSKMVPLEVEQPIALLKFQKLRHLPKEAVKGNVLPI